MAKPIVIKITGDTKGLQKAVANTEGMLSGLGGKWKQALVGGVAAGGVIAAKALFDIGVMAQEMESIIVKGTGASGTALDELVTSSREVLAAVPDSSEIVAGALADVNTFFAETGEQLEDTTELFLDFARLTGTDVTASVAALDGVMTQFGDTNSIDENLGDLVRIAQATGIEMGNLTSDMATFGPVFANAGFTLEETAAVMGQLKQAGVDLSRVGPALNAFFRKTADSGRDPQQAIKAITETIQGATTDTAALNIATEAFGSEGAQRMVSAIRSGNFDLEDFNGLLGDGAGLVDAQTAATESFGDKWNTIKNQVFVKVMPVAERLFDVIMQGMDDIGPTVTRVVAWFKDVLWPEIQDVMVDIEVVVRDAIDIVTEIWDRWGEDIVRITTVLVKSVMDKITAILEVIKGVFKLIKGVLAGDWSLMWEGVKQIVSGAISFIVTTITQLPKLLLAVAPLLWDAGKGLMSQLLEGMKNALGAVGGFASDVGSAVLRAVKGVVNRNVIDKINRRLEFTIGGRFGVPSIKINPPDIPRLAFGGDVTRTGPVLIGERGPEILNLPKGSSVTPNHEGGTVGGGVTINVATNADAADIGREIAWLMNTGGM